MQVADKTSQNANVDNEPGDKKVGKFQIMFSHGKFQIMFL